LAHRLISFVSLVGSSTHRLFCDRLTAAVIEATKNYMAAQASSSTWSCHLAIKRYQNCSLNLLFHRLVTSHSFACEGEDVVVACSCEEKDVVMDCLFWQIQQR
jgi:hypothetical protein